MKIIALFTSILFLVSCQTKESSPSNVSAGTEVDVEISGVVQKGPFISGADVSIFELDSKMFQTGKSFFTNTTNNKGKFKAKGKLTSGRFFEVVTSGYFFDEISGVLSNGPITLRVLSDTQDTATTNVNILTHMQSSRMKVLMTEGKTYEASQTQAAEEVLSTFGITVSVSEFKSLDLTKNSLSNAALLYVSATLMNLAHRNAAGSVEAELIESLTNITEDLSEDGEVDDSTYQTKILDAIASLDTGLVELNLRNRLTQIGEDPSTVPSLELLTLKPWSTIINLSGTPSGLECISTTCYLFGPFTSFQKVNLETHSIQNLPDLPFSHGYGYMNVVKVGTDLYIPRFTNSSTNELWKYSTSGSSWTQLTSSLGAHQHSMSAIHVSGIIYLLADGASTYSEAYDIATDTWSTIASNSNSRSYPSSFHYNGNIYLLGGAGYPSNPVVDIEVYNISTNTWSSITPSANVNTSSLIGFSGHNATILVGGGPMGGLPKIFVWDVLANTWTEKSISSQDIQASWTTPLLVSDVVDGISYALSLDKLLKYYH